ncbi:MAG TPA: hypothetical protein VD963_06020 [Phycisphaerales bacterium]|nr:hypothetical protein [Phycisphaerales bacterium]
MPMPISRALLVCGAVAGAASAARADVLVTFGYTDLAGSFNSGTSVFSATAIDMAGVLRSDGNVSRLPDGAPGGTALFDPGFVSLPGPADFMLSVNVTGIGPNTATGTGAFMILDANGDMIMGDISGTFVRGNNGATFFNADLSNVMIMGMSGDGLFNGTDGGAFSLNFGAISMFEGSLVQLMTRPAGVGFFTQSFSNISTEVSGQLIPAPGAAAVLLGSGVLASRRRRR